MSRCDERLKARVVHGASATCVLQNVDSLLRWLFWSLIKVSNDTRKRISLSHFLMISLRRYMCISPWSWGTSVSHGSTKKDRKTKEFQRIVWTVFVSWKLSNHKNKKVGYCQIGVNLSHHTTTPQYSIQRQPTTTNSSIDRIVQHKYFKLF